MLADRRFSGNWVAFGTMAKSDSQQDISKLIDRVEAFREELSSESSTHLKRWSPRTNRAKEEAFHDEYQQYRLQVPRWF
jgi:hypothetical protein